jgi:hypothetical protein
MLQLMTYSLLFPLFFELLYVQNFRQSARQNLWLACTAYSLGYACFLNKSKQPSLLTYNNKLVKMQNLISRLRGIS